MTTANSSINSTLAENVIIYFPHIGYLLRGKLLVRFKLVEGRLLFFNNFSLKGYYINYSFILSHGGAYL